MSSDPESDDALEDDFFDVSKRSTAPVPEKRASGPALRLGPVPKRAFAATTSVELDSDGYSESGSDSESASGVSKKRARTDGASAEEPPANTAPALEPPPKVDAEALQRAAEKAAPLPDLDTVLAIPAPTVSPVLPAPVPSGIGGTPVAWIDVNVGLWSPQLWFDTHVRQQAVNDKTRLFTRQFRILDCRPIQRIMEAYLQELPPATADGGLDGLVFEYRRVRLSKSSLLSGVGIEPFSTIDVFLARDYGKIVAWRRELPRLQAEARSADSAALPDTPVLDRPEGPGEAARIRLRVRTEAGATLTFRVALDRPLAALRDRFRAETGSAAARLFFDNDEIDYGQTAASYDMEDDELIDARA